MSRDNEARPLTGIVRVRAYGRTVGIRAPEPVLKLAHERLPPTYKPHTGPAERCWTVRNPAPDKWLVLVDDVELSEHDGPTAATEAMLSDLELWVAGHTQRAVFVHAGCVVAGARAILIPGYSRSGKTSLTAALVRAGALYYSDEFAVLDHRGLVRPYPRSLSVRTADGARTQRVPARALGGQIGRRARAGRPNRRAPVRHRGRMEHRAANAKRSRTAAPPTHGVRTHATPGVAERDQARHLRRSRPRRHQR